MLEFPQDQIHAFFDPTQNRTTQSSHHARFSGRVDKCDDDDKADSKATHGRIRCSSRPASLLAMIRQDKAIGAAYTIYWDTQYAMASFIDRAWTMMNICRNSKTGSAKTTVSVAKGCPDHGGGS